MDIVINWRLRKQRLKLMGQECPVCNIKLFPPEEICPCYGYRFDTCPRCGCQYDRKCEHISDDISNIEIGC
jgi:hypothetical protein